MSTLSDKIALLKKYYDSVIDNEPDTIYKVILRLLGEIGYTDDLYKSQKRTHDSRYIDMVMLGGSEVAWYLEAKSWKVPLKAKEIGQLLSYCNSDNIRFGVLTNGEDWHLYDNYIHDVSTAKLVRTARLGDPNFEKFMEMLSVKNVQCGSLSLASQEHQDNRIIEAEITAGSDLDKAIKKYFRSSSGREIGIEGVIAAVASMRGNTETSPKSPNQAAATTTRQAAPIVAIDQGDLITKKLSEIDGDELTKTQPTTLLIGNEKIEVDHWRDVFTNCFKELAKLNRIPEDPWYLPNGTQEIISSKTKRKHSVPIEVNAITYNVYVNLSAKGCVSTTKNLCRALNYDAGSITIAFRRN